MALLTGSFLYDAIGIFIALIATLIAYTKWKFSYLSRKGLYTKPLVFPYGNATKTAQQKESIGEMFLETYKDIKGRGLKHGGAYFFITPFYVPTDLGIVKSILQNDFSHFKNHGFYMNKEGDPLSANLFNLEDDEWKDLRAKLTPTFTSGKMKMMFNTMADCSKGLQQMLEEYSQSAEPLDIKDILQRFTIDIIGSCAFGLECNSMKDPNSEFAVNGRKIFEPSLRNSIRDLLVFSIPHSVLRFFNLRTLNVTITNFIMDVVRNTVDYRERNNVYRKDFMHLLLQLKNRGKVFDDEKISSENALEKEGLSFNEIAAQVFVFFIAGYETSSTTMTFTLLELAQRPDLQQKLREEIVTVLAKHDGKLTYDAIKEMTYMDQVINEGLRKYPPVPLLPRVCSKTYNVPGTDVVLQKGDKVVISAYGIHYDPDYYPDPEKFDPNRFSEENKKKRNPIAWLPFGEGPRACIGLRFGMMQTKVGLATIVKDYDISLSIKTTLPVKLEAKSFVTTAEGGVWINIKKHA